MHVYICIVLCVCVCVNYIGEHHSHPIISYSVIPHVKQDLHEDVIKQSKQVTQLMTMSEMFSQCAYTRPLSAARLGAEVTSVVNTRSAGSSLCIVF